MLRVFWLSNVTISALVTIRQYCVLAMRVIAGYFSNSRNAKMSKIASKKPKHIIVCEKSPERARFVSEHYPSVEVVAPEDCIGFHLILSDCKVRKFCCIDNFS